MKAFKLFVLLISISMIIASCQKTDIEVNKSLETEDYLVQFQEDYPIIKGSYIVQLRADVIPSSKFKADMPYDERSLLVEQAVIELEKEITGTTLPVIQTYHASIHGFAGELTEAMVNKLEKDPRVISIEHDRVIALAPPPGKGKDKDTTTPDDDPPQVTPWGITRVNGASSYTGSKRAWIIDTGLDLDHNDLNVNTTGLNKSFLVGKGGKNPDDANGHGTHVAGIVAAKNNDIGVIGVAPGAEVISVRVLDATASGRYSGIIAGVDYVADNFQPGDVANMSIGSPIFSSLDNAVVNAASTGCIFVIAAGNNRDNASYYTPARSNGPYIYTVSAMRNGDTWASFSNYGNPPIEYCEPGSSIFSCYKDGGYRTMGGTSMAAPHLSGILLLGSVRTDGYVSGDPDGNPDPIGVH